MVTMNNGKPIAKTPAGQGPKIVLTVTHGQQLHWNEKGVGSIFVDLGNRVRTSKTGRESFLNVIMRG